MAVEAIALLLDKQQEVEFHFYKNHEIKKRVRYRQSRQALEREVAVIGRGSYCLVFRQMAKVEFTFLVLAVGAS